MKKYKIIIAVTVILLLANTILLSFLWFGKKDQPPVVINTPPPQVENLLKEKLSLTEDQIKQFRPLKEAHAAMNRKLNDSIRPLKDGLFALLGKADVNSAVVDSFTNQISRLEKQKDINTFDHFTKVRLLLTPAQQTGFDKIINDVLRRLAGPGGPGGNRPPPAGDQQGPGDKRPFPPPGDEKNPPPGDEHFPPPPGDKPPH